jgi:hypothetical protein
VDKEIRNRIQRATQAARALLEREYAEQLEGTFDIRLDGTIAAEPGDHLDASQQVLRTKLVAVVEHVRSSVVGRQSATEAVTGYLREAAFTTLNRFVALKMLEARGLVQECISRGEQSAGFKEFTGLVPGLVQLPDNGYRLYIESLFDEIGHEVRVLFDRRDPASLLWPRRQALVDLLGILNTTELFEVWHEDETIGWVYQYFNSDEDREKARYDDKGKPKAPQTSYELAVRNQFFTPRYVVEFLTDNTLGRIWYEMRQGKTRLVDECDYLVRRPTEIFLAEGEQAPEENLNSDENLSQEKLLKKPIYIPFRARKDPRDLKILDPACGSGHFLLYAFDLLISIYEEAWEDDSRPISEVTSRNLRDDYPTLEDLRHKLPGLVLRHNLHGIDIDPRAVQIAALALWMRAQRTYNDFAIARGDRAPISKTSIVVAEPMPGEKEFRREFIAALDKHLGKLVERVFEKMDIAGGTGSLLKIEDEIQVTIRDVYGVYGDLFQKSDEERWRDAEERLLDALRSYAERAQNGQAYRRRLFAEDAAGGFAFIDMCRQGYDVVLMNPPFGDSTTESKGYLIETYPSSRHDLSAAFVERALVDLAVFGLTGVLCTDSGFFRRTHEPWRRNIVLQQSDIGVLAHLGDNVLDGAKVRVAAYTLRSPKRGFSSAYIRAISTDDRESREPRVRSGVEALNIAMPSGIVFCAPQSEFAKLPYAVFGYWCSPELRNAFRCFPALEEGVAHVRVGLQTSDDFRFLRLRWEVPPCFVNEENWLPFAKGGEYSPFHDDVHLLVRWEAGNGALAAFDASVIRNPGDYLKPGITYTPRTSKRFAPKVLPSGSLFANKGPAIVDIVDSPLAVLALLNSRPVSYLLSLGTGMAEAMDASNSYEVGLVQRLPVPPTAAEDEELSRLGLEAWMARADADLRDETTALFRSPVAPYTLKDSIKTAARQLATHLARLRSDYVDVQRAIDRRVAEFYRLSESDWKDVEEHVGNVHSPEIPDADDSVWHRELTARLLQFLVGVAVGRWDARVLHTGGPDSGLEEPFAPIPVHQDVGSGHDHTAVLVDDLGHPVDMVLGIRKALTAASVEEPDNVLGEAARYLGVSDDNIYSWFRNHFFEDHLQRYSKSRRKAPIYWQLATPSASYSVWLYYHRFTKDQ